MPDIKTLVQELISYTEEEEWFEFKENWYNPKGIGEYISSMSNVAVMKGREYAYLVWGVNNETHELIDTKFNYHVDVKGEPLEHFLARQINPDVAFSFGETEIEGKRVVVLTIPAARQVPTSFAGVRYLRVGSSKVNLSKYPDRESKLFDILRNGFPTIENTESKYQDLTFRKLFLFYEGNGISLRKNTFKKNLGLLTKDGKYNILAQLLSDDSRIPIRVSLFKGETKASALYSVREFGHNCLLLSLDKVLEYGDILNVPQADERNRVMERKEIPLFSADAFREAVINAFVHNLWIEENAPMISVFSDRIEILSRGAISPSQTKEGFYSGESVPVNQKLSDIILQLHISERSGRGVPIIIDAYGREAFQFREKSINVVIPFDKLKTVESDGENLFQKDEKMKQVEQKSTNLFQKDKKMKQVEQKNANLFQKSETSLWEKMKQIYGEKCIKKYRNIIEYLEIHDTITPQIAMKITGKSRTTVYRYLQDFIEADIIQQEGKTNNIFYKKFDESE